MIVSNTRINDFIDSLQIRVPPKERFLELSKKTAIYPDSPTSYIQNYERGILLYCLVAKNRPKAVLEIGTAQGFSSLCMAWAMVDYDIPGRIFTIDPNNAEIKLDIAEAAWVEKIEPISGYAGEVMSSHSFPKIDFAYIDGWHIYEAVRHDFFATLNSAAENFDVVFDDYFETTPIDGVKKFVDGFLAKNLDVLVIESNYREQMRELTNEPGLSHFLCYLHVNRAKINAVISEDEIKRILD
jgi:hypothetical protein